MRAALSQSCSPSIVRQRVTSWIAGAESLSAKRVKTGSRLVTDPGAGNGQSSTASRFISWHAKPSTASRMLLEGIVSRAASGGGSAALALEMTALKPSDVGEMPSEE